MKTLWFRRKTYGWGWYPTTWQGWAVILGFVIVLAWTESHFVPSLNAGHPAKFILGIVIETAVLIAICYYKGEKPKWQWGNKK